MNTHPDTLTRFVNDHRSTLVGQAERARLASQARPANTHRTRRVATRVSRGVLALSLVAVLTVAARPTPRQQPRPVSDVNVISEIAPSGGGLSGGAYAI
jgi:hypothetical protein